MVKTCILCEWHTPCLFDAAGARGYKILSHDTSFHNLQAREPKSKLLKYKIYSGNTIHF